MFTNFIHVFSPNDEHYLVLQKHSDVWLYLVKIGKPELTLEEEETNLGALVDDVCVL